MRPTLIRLYVSLALLLCIGSFAGFARLWPALGHPFGGFIWQYRDALGFTVNYKTPQHWPGPAAGLVPYTLILTIDGRPAREFGAVYATTPVGTPVTYEAIVADGTRRTFTVPVARFDLGYLLDAYGLIFVAGCMFAAGGYILIRSARTTERVLLAFILLASSVPAFFHSHNGGVATFDFESTRPFIALMWAPGPPLLGALFCHAALIYPRRGRVVTRWPWVVPLCYGAALALWVFLGLINLFGADPRLTWLSNPALYAAIGYMVMGILATLFSGGRAFFCVRDSQGRAERRRVRIVAVAWVLTVLMLFGTVAAAVLRLPTPFEFLIAFAIFLPVGLVYAITNADLIGELEQESVLRGQLLEDIRDVHQLQERILEELADELHDTALAESKALEMRLFALSQRATSGRLTDAHLAAELAQLHQQSLALRHTLRQTVEGAKPVDFGRENLVAALERMVTQQNMVSGPTVYILEHSGEVEDCSPEMKREIYWIIRAALNNVHDHARARHCTIRLLRQGSTLDVMVRDDGRGLDTETRVSLDLLPRRHLGIPAMQARAERLGGQLELMSLGRGTQVQLMIPLEQSGGYGAGEDARTHR
jgi:signal transduction histidine kinase